MARVAEHRRKGVYASEHLVGSSRAHHLVSSEQTLTPAPLLLSSHQCFPHEKNFELRCRAESNELTVSFSPHVQHFLSDVRSVPASVSQRVLR